MDKTPKRSYNQINIQIQSVTLKCPYPNLEPKFKFALPSGRLYNSRQFIRNSQGDYAWQDQVILSYMYSDNDDLSKEFLRLSVTEYNGSIIGDVEFDLYSLSLGPSLYQVPIDHGLSNCVVNFSLFVCQTSAVTIKIDSLSVEGLEKEKFGARFKLTTKSDKMASFDLIQKGNKFENEKTVAYENILSYRDLQTEAELDIYRKSNDSQYDNVKFGLQKLFISESMEYTLNTTGGHPIKFQLKLINKPKLVQALSGICHGYGRVTGYVPVHGAEVLKTNQSNHDLLKYNEPIAQPSQGAVKTYKPFVSKVIFKTFKITGKNLPADLHMKAKNTLNNKREKITLNLQKDTFSFEDYHLIQFETKRPYELNRRYLILELYSGEEFIGNLYLNLHNLFCGPPRYIMDFKCIGSYSAQASFLLDVVNSRTMKVKFNGFHIDSNDQVKDCFIKFGFEGNELRYDVAREEGGKYYFDGEYDVDISYSTASKNIESYVINVMIIEKKFMKDTVKFSAKYSLKSIVPFKTKKVVEIPFDQPNVPHFFCEINMNTSLVKPGLYGEYKLLDEGVCNNGTLESSSYKEIKTFTEFSQPLYYPILLKDENAKVSTDKLDKVECSVLSGADNEEKIYIMLSDKDLTITKLDGTILLAHPLNSNLISGYNSSQLTLITPTSHTQLYTKRARDIKSFIDSHSIKVENDNKLNIHQGFYVLCSQECKGAINVSCPVCSFHPNDFTLQKYGIAHCDICSFETYIHYSEQSDIEIDCPICESTLKTIEDTIQQSYICVCGFPLGSVCKRCNKIPNFDNPKVYIRTLCADCGQIQLINGEIPNAIPCSRCKANIDLIH